MADVLRARFHRRNLQESGPETSIDDAATADAWKSVSVCLRCDA
jgi:hypothetical protein